MDKSAGKSAKFGGKQRQSWGALFRARYPAKTAEYVAAEIGAPVRTVQNWMEGAAEPSLKWFARLATAYGLDALAVILPEHLGWLAAARRAARQAEIEGQLATLKAALDGIDGGAR